MSRRTWISIHYAALLEFGEDFAELSRKVNVGGTANVLELAERLRTPVGHLSSAYIAGTRRGTVYENETDVGQEFHNAYERTKCQAEVLVRKWSRRTGLDVFVFRPSIVVGDSEGGRILNFDGLYNLMRFFDNVGSVVGGKDFRVIGNPDATKNFIPVDYVADAIWHIIQRGSPGTYHITHPSPLRLSQLRRIFTNLFQIPGARFVPQSDFQKNQASRLERMYQEATSYYERTKPSHAVLLCSPHPHFAGNMDNNVICAIARKIAAHAVTLRFDYRGVGDSQINLQEGLSVFDYWSALEETKDYTDAVRDVSAAGCALTSATKGLEIPFSVVGYSFGAATGLLYGHEQENICNMVAIAPPLGKVSFEFLSNGLKPSLFLIGTGDFLYSAQKAEELRQTLASNTTVEILENVDHFFRGDEDVIAGKVDEFICNHTMCRSRRTSDEI